MFKVLRAKSNYTHNRDTIFNDYTHNRDIHDYTHNRDISLNLGTLTLVDAILTIFHVNIMEKNM